MRVGLRSWRRTTPRCQNALAIVSFRLGLKEEAETAIRAALRLDPDNPSYAEGLRRIAAPE